MLGPTPTAFKLIRKRDDSSGCAVCDSIPLCPPCGKGYQCQQIYRSSCQTCPVNKCVKVDDGSSVSSSKSSSLGSALGGILGAAAIGLVIFYFWRKSKRRRIALAEDARGRSGLAQEKYRMDKEGVTVQLGGATKAPGNGRPDVLDSDTEWTQMQGNTIESLDTLDPLQEPNVFKRRSFGAATHLSKITEGVEEEEEEDDEGMHSARSGQLGDKDRRSNGGRSSRYSGHGRDSSLSSSIQIGPRISIGSGATFSKNIIPITFRPSPASSSPMSPASGTPAIPVSPSPTAPAHAGAPAPPSPHDSHISMPAPAHRAVGTPIIEITGTQQPIRPSRAPELNLRLADGAEPGQLNRSSHGSAGTAMGPSLSSSSDSVGVAAAAGNQQFDFMSIDPASALQQSRVYSKADRHLSTATVNTMASTSTAGLDYMLSAPQIVTPVTADGARRVQLNKGGKAQLVRGASLKKDGGSKEGTPVSTPSAIEAADPFSDAAAAALSDEQLSPRTAASSSIGEVLLRPADPQAARSSHMSTSTLGIPFADNTLALRDPKDATPSDADRSSWLGGRHSYATSRGGFGECDEGPSNDHDRRSPFSDEAAAVAVPELSKANLAMDAQGVPSPGRSKSFDIDARSSRAESIGGLSVFDQFPIAIGTENLPADAKEKLDRVREQDALDQVHISSEGEEEGPIVARP